MNFVVGIDIGGTHIRFGAVEKTGKIHFFEKASVSSCLNPDLVSGLKEKIREFLERCKTHGKVLAISVGVPSSVSRDKSFIYSTPNLPGLNNIDLGSILKKEFGLPVFIDRDVNYLLNNDISQLNLDPDKNKNIVGIYVGTGIGNALYLNGNFYTGKNGVAGELGHIPMLGADGVCGCGHTGCSETVASGKYLEKLCEKFGDCRIEDIFVRHGDSQEIADFLKALAYVIDTEINLLDPDFVILAGGVPVMKDFPMQKFMELVKAHMREPYPLENIQFVFPEQTQEAGVRGGALLAFEKL